MAQSQSITLPLPEIRSQVDERGVDLTSGEVQASEADLSIGATGTAGLTHKRFWASQFGWRHGYMLSIKIDNTNASAPKAQLALGSNGARFTLTNGSWVSDEGDGASLIETSSSYTYTGSDGSTVMFDKGLAANNASYYGVVSGVATLITQPDGLQTKLTYKRQSYPLTTAAGTIEAFMVRLQSVQVSTGYQLKYEYASGDPATQDEWARITKVVAINNAIDYCDPAADACSGFSQNWPAVTYARVSNGGSMETVTDPQGRARVNTVDVGGRLSAIRRPGSGSDDLTYIYNANGSVSSVTVNGVGTWTYTFSPPNSPQLTGTVLAPGASRSRQIVTTVASRQTTSDTDETGRTTSYEVDPFGRPTVITAPEGNKTNIAYDSRGNVVSITSSGKGGAAVIPVQSATFPTSCTIAATCNKPTTTTDAAGNVTNYAYNNDGTLAQVLAPAVNGIRPSVSYSYVSMAAWAKTASGGYVALNPTSKLDRVTTCRTGASPCAGSDQIISKFSYAYPPNSNLQLTARTDGSGDGILAATTSYGHDAVGNITSVDGPLPGAADTTIARYNAARQITQVVGPDPDSGGPLKNRATQYSYGTDGQVSSVSQGTAGADGSNFASLRQLNTSYDVAGRKIAETSVAAGSIQGVTNFGYDTQSRLICITQRMNPAAFATPTAACSLGPTGSFGADRITRTLYDDAGRITLISQANQTSTAIDETRYTYTNNGRIDTLKDANGNVTTYVYDVYDRLSQVRYPLPGTTGASSTTDFEQLFYDNASRVATRRLRDGQQIGYQYDALNRVVSKDVPNNAYMELDVTYSYDLTGRLLRAQNSIGHYVTLSYDALGRVLSDNNVFYGKTMQYDLGGRMTRFTWADGNYIDYDYLTTGEMARVRENGATSGIGVLATFGYDDLGRRTLLARGNGTVTSYGYDAASRLASLGHDLTGTAADVTTTFDYNPAGQIVTRAASNSAYAFVYPQDYPRTNNAPSVDRTYGINALNQYTSVSSAPISYDGRGNLTSSGGNSYSYTSENRMASGAATQLYHDPLGRLSWSTAPGIRYDQTMEHITTELSGSTNAVLRRYVWGPGADEPLVQYEGAGLADRRFLLADERGSIVAVTDSAGNATAINSYDEYGLPGGSNATVANGGRFQYTGQAWLPELGLAYYKARMYSPTLGRFLQTDPIGYADGPNWYNYVGGDPVNRIDPSGTLCVFVELRRGDILQGYETRCDGKKIDSVGPEIVVTGKKNVPSSVPRMDGFPTAAMPAGSTSTGGNSPQPPECAARAPSGQCAYVRDNKGKLQLHPEYSKKACQNYKSMMTANRNIALGNAALGVPGTANAGLGGSVGWLSKTANVLGGRFMTFTRGVVGLTTALLGAGGAYSVPEGCK